MTKIQAKRLQKRAKKSWSFRLPSVREKLPSPGPPTTPAFSRVLRVEPNSFSTSVIKPFCPFWVVEGETHVFIWLLRIHLLLRF